MLPPPGIDIVAFACWLAATGLLGRAAWQLARRLYPSDGTIALVGHSLILSWATVVAVATAPGTLGVLRVPGLLVGVATLAALVLWALRRKRLRGFARPVAVDSGPLPRVPSAGVVLPRLAWGLLLAFAAGHVLTGGLLRFPTDWDTLMYHLPLVDHWLQTHSLFAPDCIHWSNPGNNELLTLWLVAPFSGDFLAPLTNLPATVLLACATFTLARQLRLCRGVAHLTALAVVGNFVVLRQLVDTENDVATAALLLAGAAYGFRYAHHGRRADLLLGALALGLLAGVKFYALGYAGTAGLTVTLLLAYRRGWRLAGRAAVVGACGGLVCGGYWYARNLLAGGSPLYPLGGSAAAGDLRAVHPGVWQTTFLGSGRPEVFPLALRAIWDMTGPCQLAAFLALPLSLGWLAVTGLARVRRGRAWAGEARLALALLTVLAGAVLLVTPFAVEDVPGTLNQMHYGYCPVRYGLCLLSLAVLGLGVVLNDLLAWARRASAAWSRPAFGVVVQGGVLGLFAAGIVFQLLARRARVPVDADAALVAINVFNLFLAGLLCRGMISWRRWRPALVVVLGTAATVGAALAAGGLSRRWHQGHAPFYDRMLGGGLFTHLRRSAAAGTRFCVLDCRPYPFFGSRRQFRVCQPAALTTCPRWLAYVRDRDVGLLVTRFDLDLGQRGWHSCRPWLAEHVELFVPLRDQHGPYGVYQVAGEQQTAREGTP